MPDPSSLSGKLSWPLVFFEEHRADLFALAAARQLFEPAMRKRVVAYHLAHRLGPAFESCEADGPAAGLIPFLLVSVLLDQGLLSIAPTPTSAGRVTYLANLEEVEDTLSRHASLMAEIDTRLAQDRVALAMEHAIMCGSISTMPAWSIAITCCSARFDARTAELQKLQPTIAQLLETQ